MNKIVCMSLQLKNCELIVFMKLRNVELEACDVGGFLCGAVASRRREFAFPWCGMSSWISG